MKLLRDLQKQGGNLLKPILQCFPGAFLAASKNKSILATTTVFSNSSSFFNKAGFTLAEVLITLGVIGIVAAMTIPTLMTKIQNRQYGTAYKKALSTLNQALRNANDDGALVSMKDGGEVDTGHNTGLGLTGKNFVAITKYMTGVTSCFDGDNTACWECNGQAGKIVDNYMGCNKQSYAFIDASGTQYYLYNSDEWPIVIDVNGVSKPNELGRDRYVVYFANSFNSGYYSDDVDTIKPLHDLETKQRWCPSGYCPFTSRLFGDSSKKSNHPWN